MASFKKTINDVCIVIKLILRHWTLYSIIRDSRHQGGKKRRKGAGVGVGGARKEGGKERSEMGWMGVHQHVNSVYVE